MKEDDKVIIEEVYNQQGICIKRTANGKELPADTEPSIVILDAEVFNWYKQIKILTKVEAKERGIML